MPDLNKKYFDNPSEIPADKISELVTGCSEAAIKDTLTTDQVRLGRTVSSLNLG